jgi:trehalose 6-phosphate synthase
MTSFYDLRDFFSQQGYKVIIAADGETRMHVRKDDQLIMQNVHGGVATALDTLAQASKATYIGRARTEEDREGVDKKGKVVIKGAEEDYTLKRIFLTEKEIDDYYFGFSNQTLWPLCHAAFEKPIFNKEWYEGYKAVNQKFAKAIREEISGKTFVWIQDYQLALVPLFLGRQKDVVTSLFWHIPWPTWEIFRVLPVKRDILWSLLSTDFLAFHRGYQAKNFMTTVQRELAVMVDDEKRMIHFDKNNTTVRNLPLGIDVDVIKNIVAPPLEESFLLKMLRDMVGGNKPEETAKQKSDDLDTFFRNYKVILGVDRLDYTKGVPYRLRAIEAFFDKYPNYRKKAVYIGIMSPSRDKIPSYKLLKEEIDSETERINAKFAVDGWKPINLIHQSFTREDVMNLYKKAQLCLVTPLDDGMNLVSKEFIIAQSFSKDPGMLVLSQFAGSAIDLGAALIVNPYDVDQVAENIKIGLEMSTKEKGRRAQEMVEHMEQRNIYAWAEEFVREAISASRENRR